MTSFMPVITTPRMYYVLSANSFIKHVVYSQSTLHFSGFLIEFQSLLVNCVRNALV